ncbi:hypothetical protein MKW94_002545 [Papaver nudicaule]|uniref:H(+)-transporting two-sector ATPase n=1 Tax=Papaver nudicaule TaxID=74823 RepID=A0AA41V9B4_PAPNU|nr:hypothetical protein [Papaver nudicaule]
MKTNPTPSGLEVSTLEEKKLGRVAQIIGPVLDISFPQKRCLANSIYNVLVVKGRDTVDGLINVTLHVDNLGHVDTCTTSPINRFAPAFIQLDKKSSIFETGIKLVDHVAPY